MVQPNVIVMAHTATSYTLGTEAEKQLIARTEKRTSTRFVTALGCVLAAFQELGVRKIAYATPYNVDMTLRGKNHLESCGIEVVGYGNLSNVRNIYEENTERAYGIARFVDHADADLVFLSGVGMPTLDVLKTLEDDLGKPVVSAASAMMWHALKISGVYGGIAGYGKLLAAL